jgi:hypothetical protein
MAEIIKSTMWLDLNEIAVLDFCIRLGVTPHGEALLASANWWDTAHRVAEKLHMQVIMAPPDMFKKPNAWAVITAKRGMMWSEGA